MDVLYVGELWADARLLAAIDGDPLLAVRGAGDGRAPAYTSDAGPTWRLERTEWADYGTFSQGALEWVTWGSDGRTVSGGTGG